jgi:TonB family protein
MRSPWALLLIASSTVACVGEKDAQKVVEAIWQGGPRPDSMPVMLNAELPFRYPLSLWTTRVQGNVVLRIHIDSIGLVAPESTSVVESSGYPPLDSAAVKGSEELRFRPAVLRGRPMALSIQLPVFFRHPEAAPLPGDSVLKRSSAASPRADSGAVTPPPPTSPPARP